MMPHDSATVRVPGSIGNVGPGLDVLGLAVAGAHDTVTMAWREAPGLVVRDAGHPALPTDPLRNTAAIAAAAVLARCGVPRGATLTIVKGLPLSGGQGGSAASAVAGAVAANALAAGGLDAAALLECALEGEAAVAGRHGDNLAPSLLGGLVLVRSIAPMDVVTLPVPAELVIVLAHPAQTMATREARAVLPTTVTRDLAIAQMADVAALVAGACLGDLALLGRGLTDRIAEPPRATLLPGFAAAKRAALEAGALGCSISGAGPTAFALCDSTAAAERVAAAMVTGYASEGVSATARVTRADRDGAVVLP
jgi:homoserine kinase